jgi:hypothetical protein
MTQEEELQRCKEDTVYLYNTYTEQGKRRPITQREYDLFTKYNGRYIFLKGRRSNYIGSLIDKLEEQELV